MTTIPKPAGLPGGCMYEPKWDGFRLVIVREADVILWSRQGKDLTRHFPDLAVAAEQLPEGYVIDGEAIVWTDDRLDFAALQQRLTTSATAVARLAREQPASYAAFDVIAIDNRDARPLPLRDRRTLLEQIAESWELPLNLSPMTTKPVARVKDGLPFTVAKGDSYDLVSFKLSDPGKIDKVSINGTVKDLSDDAWSDVNFITPGIFGAVTGLNEMTVYDVAGNTSIVRFVLN